MKHRECPRCEKCVHRTVEYGAYIHRFVVSCDAKECNYERKDKCGDSDTSKRDTEDTPCI